MRHEGNKTQHVVENNLSKSSKSREQTLASSVQLSSAGGFSSAVSVESWAGCEVD